MFCGYLSFFCAKLNTMLDKQNVITRRPEHGDKRHDVNSKDRSMLHFLEINTFIPPLYLTVPVCFPLGFIFSFQSWVGSEIQSYCGASFTDIRDMYVYNSECQ